MKNFDSLHRIYFKQTRKNIEEILNCYYSENYRAAIVMLYSVVISDLCLKLQNLSEVEGDGKAKEILKECLNKQKDCTNKHSYSEWEYDLINQMYQKGYINNKVFNDIDFLYRERCFCAHPTMTSGFDLLKPSKETTLAHISNMINEVFNEPPYFSKNVSSKLVNDLAEKCDALDTYEKLSRYLDEFYFSRSDFQIKCKIFEAFWKFCFELKNDENCIKNNKINLDALTILIEKNQNIIDEEEKKGFSFNIENDDRCISNGFYFLSRFVNVYKLINDISKDYLKKKEAVSNNELLSWFLYDNFELFLDDLKNKIIFWDSAIKENSFKMFKEKCILEGKSDFYIDLCIDIFKNSPFFENVVGRYEICIKPIIHQLNVSQVETIIEIVCNERVIHDCWAFDTQYKNEIAKIYCDKSGKKIDSSKYSKFVCSEEYFMIQVADNND